MPFKQRAMLLSVLLWAYIVEWMLNWRDCHSHVPLKSVGELHWAVILALLWRGTLTGACRMSLCKAWEVPHLPGTFPRCDSVGAELHRVISVRVSCSLYQWQITSSSSAVECGTDKDEAVSIQDAAKWRAQNEILVCTGESTALTGDLPASRAPLLF